MQKQGTTWRCLAVLAVLVGFGRGVFGGAGADNQEAPGPLPPEIVKAWRDAGADTGWMKNLPPQSEGGYGYWVPWREQGEPGAVPAFRFHPEKEGVLAKLPDPGVALGLDTHCSAITDAELKDLSGLKNLRALNVGGSLLLTDAGLKELAGLKNLQGLYLFYTPVTDAGLKELGRLKSLQALDLSHTRVTDARVEGLARLESLRAPNLPPTKGAA